MEKSGISSQFIKVLLRDFICDKDQSELTGNAKAIVHILHSNMTGEKYIPYDVIAEYVFESEKENSSEKNEVLNTNIEILLKHFDGKEDDRLTLVNNLEKIRTNYSLAQIQKEYITKASKNVSELISKLVPVVGAIEDQTKESQNRMADIEDAVKSVKETKSSIYTDFIAILGVFSAFVFVLFGGIEVARAIFDVGEDLQKMDLSKMVTISSLLLIGILTLLYSLLLWIARITGKEFGNCMDEKCKYGCKHKWKHLFKRHSFYFTIMIIFTGIAFISYNFF